jgi:phage portal protein BeeE
MPRPDQVTIILGTRRDGGEVGDIDTEVIGYAYKPTPPGRVQVMLLEQTAHWFTMPDPTCPHRGISWLSPVIGEIQADKAATAHKLKFFENGATANTAVTLDANLSPDEFAEWVDLFEEGHKGALNAYKTLFLAGGADAKVIGADMVQMDFTNTQGHGEARASRRSSRES